MESVPSHVTMLWPTLEAVKAIGGSGTIEEINEKVVELEQFSEEQQSILHDDGPRNEIEYRLAWARTYLKGMGALENSARGVWSITDEGRRWGEDEIRRRLTEYRRKLRDARRVKAIEGSPDEETDDVNASGDWKAILLEFLLDMPPDRFEHLARRLLREAGFVNTTVTGKSGDGGIDGIGVYRLSLVSFPVFFQCKRYRGSVRASAVRDFRGAMAGRGDKGLLITTGAFTAEAKQEATRDGAPPIDLIDGERLCLLLKEHALGVQTLRREIEDVTIDAAFFKNV
jgi:restriction system protein